MRGLRRVYLFTAAQFFVLQSPVTALVHYWGLTFVDTRFESGTRATSLPASCKNLPPSVRRCFFQRCQHPTIHPSICLFTYLNPSMLTFSLSVSFFWFRSSLFLVISLSLSLSLSLVIQCKHNAQQTSYNHTKKSYHMVYKSTYFFFSFTMSPAASRNHAASKVVGSMSSLS